MRPGRLRKQPFRPEESIESITQGGIVMNKFIAFALLVGLLVGTVVSRAVSGNGCKCDPCACQACTCDK